MTNVVSQSHHRSGSTSTRRPVSRRRWLRPVTAAVIVASTVLATSVTADASGAPWSYSGSTGPAFWGSLDPAYATCGTGRSQSPIDITDPVRRPERGPRVHYVTGTGTFFNNGHTVEAEANAGSTLSVGGVSYTLEQMHFHSVSEHEIDGRHFAMEVHFVHKSPSGAEAVVAVLVEPGRKDNRAWDPYVRSLTVPVGSEVEATVDWSALLPRDRRNYRYQGSLTTPPCTEGVSWLVMARPVRLSARQIAAFRAVYSDNHRPVQPLDGRTVTLDLSAR